MLVVEHIHLNKQIFDDPQIKSSPFCTQQDHRHRDQLPIERALIILAVIPTTYDNYSEI